MKITPPADDYGLQKLKQADSNRAVKETGKVDAYPRIESSEERHEAKEPFRERRQQRRRKRERRQLSYNTPLDTRDSHERRRELRREEEDAAAASASDSASHGIDDFA